MLWGRRATKNTRFGLLRGCFGKAERGAATRSVEFDLPTLLADAHGSIGPFDQGAGQAVNAASTRACGKSAPQTPLLGNFEPGPG